MKKVMILLLIMAGLNLTVAIIMKLGGVVRGILGTVPSSYLELTKIFLLGAIAWGIYGGQCRKEK